MSSTVCENEIEHLFPLSESSFLQLDVAFPIYSPLPELWNKDLTPVLRNKPSKSSYKGGHKKCH